MLRFFYSLLFYLGIPAVLARLYFRSRREPGYRADLSQRFGSYKSQHAGRLIWIHAVSAGETNAALPLIRRLAEAGYPCLVTNMTPTGRDRMAAIVQDLDLVENAYAPYDLPGSVARFLRNNQPRMFVTIDTELWPNILYQCEQQNIPAVMVNARMSDRSAQGYERISGLAEQMLQSVDVLATQTQPHAERFIALGARQETVTVAGSIKFDGQFSDDYAERSHQAAQMVTGRPVLLAASTHEGEEAALLRVLPSLQNVLPDVLLVIAPRHTHRCEAVVSTCDRMGYPPVAFTQMTGKSIDADCAVMIIDVMGELDAFFPIARLAFVGGSLVPVGGHNLLEAVRSGCPVVMGHHLDNIEDITQQFIDAEAMSVVADQNALSDEIIGYMRDEGRARSLASKAETVLLKNRGSLDRVETLIIEALSQ